MSSSEKLANAVFEGGGVKGSALVGALRAAELNGYEFVRSAGTSAGAIIAALLSSGYSALEMKKIMDKAEYTKFKDEDFVDKLPFLGHATSVITENGIFEGKYFQDWIRKLLAKKGIKTFADLKIKDEDNSNSQYKLQVIASDITRGKLIILPQDMVDYGVDPDDVEIASAIRMSMSIPYFYEPVIIRHRKKSFYIVDGGILSNFPVWLYDKINNQIPTFGFKLVDPNETKPHEIKGPISLFSALFSTMMEAHDSRYIKDTNFLRTIPIPTLGVQTTDFDIKLEKKRALYMAGLKSGREFFKKWDFEKFKEKKEVLAKTGRRQQLLKKRV